MLVIGVDPGSINTGIAWVMGTQNATHAQVETISCPEVFPARYAIFREKFEGFLAGIPEDPAAIAMEEPIDSQDKSMGPEDYRSILRMNGTYAIVVAEVTRAWPKAQLFAWKPKLWRKFGEDKKKTVQRMAVKYNVRFTSDDESDALGIADHAWLLMSQQRGRAAETWIAKSVKNPQDGGK